MHHSQIAVAICNATTKKPFREYSFSSEKPTICHSHKKCEIVMPFETEYCIMIKNQNNRRIILDIDIDGTSVTDRGVIINAFDKVFLERSVEVASKFKFVSINNEAVSDPTNKENGLINIRIRKEIEYEKYPLLEKNKEWVNTKPQDPAIWTSDNTGDFNKSRYPDTNMFVGDNISSANSMDWMKEECNRSYDVKGFSSFNCSSVAALASNSVKGSAGATIEGSASQQSFNTTTWKGVDYSELIEFSFLLKGFSEMNTMSAVDQAEYEQYLKLKEKFG